MDEPDRFIERASHVLVAYKNNGHQSLSIAAVNDDEALIEKAEQLNKAWGQVGETFEHWSRPPVQIDYCRWQGWISAYWS